MLKYLMLEKAEEEEFNLEGPPIPLCKAVKIIIAEVTDEKQKVKLNYFEKKINESF